MNPLLRRDLPYRVTDFAPVAHLAVLPFAVTVRQGLPWTMADFVAHVRANPGRVSVGNSGPGAALHLAAAQIGQRLGLDWIHVTYRGDAQQVNDLLAGTLDVAMLGGPPALAAERSGRARIIGWTSPARLPHLPDHPVFAETWPGLALVGWFGLHVPARTPPEAIARLNAEAIAALAGDPALRERLVGEGLIVAPPRSPAEFAAFLDSETQRLAPVIEGLRGSLAP